MKLMSAVVRNRSHCSSGSNGFCVNELSVLESATESVGEMPSSGRKSRRSSTIFATPTTLKTSPSRTSLQSEEEVKPITEVMSLITRDRKVIAVKARVFDFCDLDKLGSHTTTGLQLQIEEDSRLVEKMLALLDAEDLARAKIIDDKGVLKRGLEPWLLPLLALADRWGARRHRDQLCSVFVKNFERIFKPCLRQAQNPFIGLSGCVLKMIFMPLVQRINDEQVRKILSLLRECSTYKQKSCQDVHALRKVIDQLEDRLEELDNH